MYRILNAIPAFFNKKNEDRVLQALRGPRMPRWVKSVRRAEPELEKHGVDVVVTTDRKEIFLQIKPNYWWAGALKGYARYALAIIVCDDTTMDEHLHMRIREGLEYGYNRT